MERRPLVKRKVRVRDDEVRIEFLLRPESRAFGARAERIVERKEPGLELGNRDSAVGARVFLREKNLAFLRDSGSFGGISIPRRDIGPRNENGSARTRERGLDRFRKSLADILAKNDAVNDDFDRMLFLLVEFHPILEIDEESVDSRADESGVFRVGDYFLVLAFLAANDRGEDLDLRSFGPLENRSDDLVDGLLAYLLAALWTMGTPDPGEQKTVVIVNLRHRSDGRTRILVRRFLLYRDGRRESFDIVNVRFVHAAQKLPRVRGKGLYIAPLALGKNRVEGERAFARTGKPRNDDEFVPGKFNIYILEIVLARTLYDKLAQSMGGRLCGLFHDSIIPIDWQPVKKGKAHALRGPLMGAEGIEPPTFWV